MPDIIGFQEVLPDITEYLDENLPQYTIVGNGREEDLNGKNNCIAFRNDMFRLISLETTWLSHTPYVSGSQLSSSDNCPRICTAITLGSKENNKLFRIFNTHLDWQFDNIRLEQLQILNDFIESYEERGSLPTILTGDLNCTPDSEEIRYILNEFKVDLADISTADHIGGDITFHDYYSDKDNKGKIDYIFATKDLIHKKSYIDDTEEDGVYLSDHYPVYAEVEIG